MATLPVMTITTEATIENGRIIPDEPEKLPANGRVVLTVTEKTSRKPDWQKVKAVLGTVKFPLSGMEYERMVRAEWDIREAREFRSLL